MKQSFQFKMNYVILFNSDSEKFLLSFSHLVLLSLIKMIFSINFSDIKFSFMVFNEYFLNKIIILDFKYGFSSYIN